MADEIIKSTGSSPTKQDIEALEEVSGDAALPSTLNVAHMTPEHRVRVEKSLKRKLDARCALFVLIYIMNYLDVSTVLFLLRS